MSTSVHLLPWMFWSARHDLRTSCSLCSKNTDWQLEHQQTTDQQSKVFSYRLFGGRPQSEGLVSALQGEQIKLDCEQDKKYVFFKNSFINFTEFINVHLLTLPIDRVICLYCFTQWICISASPIAVPSKVKGGSTGSNKIRRSTHSQPSDLQENMESVDSIRYWKKIYHVCF